ncbi:WW domain-containing oxidoreductase [Colletotrichum karsti]|uniref:WW domain-containing oxidoreductase n=1 Tax=Colletotrichum karsti TaxID=1095194 RepID=A0A9P6HUA8_9PEZI|nr:WW domain-containing oxidoreductase [Colletotrichum karsti]KAF9870454.1 WW domain-containing oxidoreductase [Colletotrichum karsti]
MSRYTEAHAKPIGPGDSRPTALQIVQDEGLEGKLKGKIFVITGTSSGLGIETVRALAVTGATLYLTARNLAKAKAALANIFDSTHMKLFEMDQESLGSVRSAAKAILAETDRVNVLINNAGIMGVKNLQFTKDGHELQFGTNHLSHFLFFQLLKPALLAASTSDFPSRVVNVASAGHRFHGINESGDYNYEKSGYDAFQAYGQSKTANIYMANEIERRYGSRGLHATSLHPGVIDTPLSKHIDPAQLSEILTTGTVASQMKSPEQGAATTVWAAVGKEWGSRGGRFLTDCMEAVPEQDDSDIYDGRFYAPHAYDAEKEKRLWKDSLELVGLEDDY